MRMLIVDDHEVVRRGLRSLLADQADWEVCGEAVDGQDALAKAQQLKPDLILMDVSMPKLHGLEATHQLRSTLPGCEVLILSQHDSGELARQALKAGARGYVIKSSISKDLIAAITKVSSHDYFFDPKILDQKSSAYTDFQEILQPTAEFEKELRESEERLGLGQSKHQFAEESEALRKLNDSSSRLWQMQSLHDGLQEMLSATIELVSADKGNVQILNTERGVLTIEAQRGFERDFLDFFREVSASDDTACGRTLRKRERTVIEDVDEDAPYAPYRDVARAAGYRAVISSPLAGKNGAPLGILSLHFHLPHRPSDEDLRRLDLYVRQASDFIERCKIDEKLRESEQRFRVLSASLDAEVRARTKELEEKNANLLRQSELLRKLSHDLFRTQDEERRRIARELHDSAGQILAALGMSLDQAVQEAEHAAPMIAKRLGEVQGVVQQLNREIRTTSYLLHPPLLDESGLSSALRVYLEGLNERSEIAVTLDIREDFGRLPGDMELAIFRVVQECVTNIHRHSGSKTALIHVSRSPENIRVEIRDEGTGIPRERLAEIQAGVSGVGVRGMQERMREFGGAMNIESDGSGTCILVSIPVPKRVGSTDVKPLKTAMRAGTLSASAKPHLIG